MACEYGVPQFFATFTANEFGWSDMKQAIHGAHFAEAPVDATRHYHYRWEVFKDMFLKPGTKSPIGTIERTWYRHEDQARGSLHVHMAIWVVKGTEDPTAIIGTAPRNCNSPEERAWRNFVLKVQTHNCQKKCFYRHGEQTAECKGGYPRNLRDTLTHNDDTKRYEYTCLEKEDQRISPYVTLWLLAWGANVNVQYVTSAAFLGYIAKYVTKAEPHGLIGDTDALRKRENISGQQRWLQGRIIRSPEVVFRLLNLQMHTKTGVKFICTNPPGFRKRHLKKQSDEDLNDDEDDEHFKIFSDGMIETYMNRPHSVPHNHFDTMTYPEFHSKFRVLSYKNIPASARQSEAFWRCINQAPDTDPVIPNENSMLIN